MKKDEILNASRKEHRNKDLAEMEVVYQAGSHASRVGALVCCLLSLLSSVLAHTMIYSPWVISISIIPTLCLVCFIKMKRWHLPVQMIPYPLKTASERSEKG